MKNRLLSWLATSLIHLVGRLSLSGTRRLGRTLGKAAYFLNTRMSKITLRNIELCFPELTPNERMQFCKRSLEETGSLAAEACRIWTHEVIVEDYILKKHNEHLALEPLAEGKGLLILAPHIGNWEIVGYYLGNIAPTTNMFLPPKLIGLDKLIRTSRSKTGSTLVPTTARGVAGMVKALKRGEIAGLLPDQQPKDHKSGVFAPFYGRPALTMTLAGGLIQRSKCAVVFAFAKRITGGFELILEAPSEAIYDADPVVAATAINAGIEKLIAHAPEQYQWDYKRFRTTADVSQSHYHD